MEAADTPSAISSSYSETQLRYILAPEIFPLHYLSIFRHVESINWKLLFFTSFNSFHFFLTDFEKSQRQNQKNNSLVFQSGFFIIQFFIYYF